MIHTVERLLCIYKTCKNWAAMSQIVSKHLLTSKFLSSVIIPDDILSCKDPNCKEPEHIEHIDSLYKDIVNGLQKAGVEALGEKSRGKYKVIPGWNEHIKDVHAAAGEAFIMWISNGKPRSGHYADLMRGSRAQFKHALRSCRNEEDRLRADALARNLMNKDNDVF